MFNPNKIWRNRLRFSQRIMSSRFSLRKKRPKTITRQASKKRREKSLMKRRHFGLDLNRQKGIPLDKFMKPKTNILAERTDGKQAKD